MLKLFNYLGKKHVIVSKKILVGPLFQLYFRFMRKTKKSHIE